MGNSSPLWVLAASAKDLQLCEITGNCISNKIEVDNILQKVIFNIHNLHTDKGFNSLVPLLKLSWSLKSKFRVPNDMVPGAAGVSPGNPPSGPAQSLLIQNLR